MNGTHSLIQRLPKCELHIHIEGSLEPELMLAIGCNGIEASTAADKAKALADVGRVLAEETA